MRGPAVIYVGNLPDKVREQDLLEVFEKYGRIRAVDIKMPPRPPPFAFVEFEEPRDAEDAAHARDGYEMLGSKLRVELAKGGNPRARGQMRGPVSARRTGTGYRVQIKNLPPSASWQDLKDFFRQIVKPSFTEVYREAGAAVGVAEFDTYDDMRYAIDKLDRSEFKNPFEKTTIRIYEDDGRGGGGGGGVLALGAAS